MALLAVGVVVGRATSPAEVAARRRPPPARAATAEVRRLQVRDLRTGTCDVALGGARDVVLAGVPAGVEAAVVTAVDVAPGQPLAPGTRLVEVAGRPVIGLSLPFALYRDLAPGAEGPDVSAVQTALAGLGLLGDHDDGRFDRATEAAVTALYERVGAEAPRTGTDLDAALDAARAGEDALLGRAEAGEPVPAAERRAAADAVRAAAAAVGVVVPRAEVAVVPAEGTVAEVAVRVGSSVAPGDDLLTTAGSGAVTTCRFGASALDGAGAEPTAELVLADGDRVPGHLGGLRVDEDGDLVGRFAGDPDPVPEDAGPSPVEVVVAATEGEVVAVPVGALREQPDGGLGVVVGATEDTPPPPIEVGLVAGGWAEVRSGDVEPGDEVVVTAEPGP